MPRTRQRYNVTRQLVAVEAAMRLCSEVDFYMHDKELSRPGSSGNPDVWWNALSPAEKRRYLREHPRSKQGKQARGKKSSRLEKVRKFAKKAGSAYRTGKDLYDRYGRYVLPLIV